MKPTISPVGDCAISIDFGQVIDPKINRQIRQVIEQIKVLQLSLIHISVATMNDGLHFAGDNGNTVIDKTLNEKLEIVGGADAAKLSDNNIGVNAKDGKLQVQLAKDLNLSLIHI